MTNLHVCRDPQDLYEQATALFMRLSNEAAAARGRFTVALSGGSTPKGLYALLGKAEIARRIPWSQISLFWGDERCVPPTHPESNYHMVEETLLSHVPIPPRNIHRIPTERDPLQAASSYEAVLREAFALADNAWPRFDLILLGIGTDGHTASLFPATAGLHENTRLVIAHYVDKLQAWRVTLTPPVINKAAHVVFLACGADKAEPLREILQGTQQPERLPAQLVRPSEGVLLWLVDEAAASLLKREEPTF
jgi:6-phosphogluconolactonase